MNVVRQTYTWRDARGQSMKTTVYVDMDNALYGGSIASVALAMSDVGLLGEGAGLAYWFGPWWHSCYLQVAHGPWEYRATPGFGTPDGTSISDVTVAAATTAGGRVVTVTIPAGTTGGRNYDRVLLATAAHDYWVGHCCSPDGMALTFAGGRRMRHPIPRRLAVGVKSATLGAM